MTCPVPCPAGRGRCSGSPSPLASIAILHTLGPEGTNCHAAAERWFARRPHRPGRFQLHTTLEAAVRAVRADPEAALLACAAYPKLHEIVFENLAWLDMRDGFVLPTHPMVLARRRDETAPPASVATHPAPQALVPAGLERRLSTSNAQAAIDCAAGLADACITTAVAAHAYGLAILRNYGSVGMAFTVHSHRRPCIPATEV